MKKMFLIALVFAFGLGAKAQDKPHIYNPNADAGAEITAAVKQAAKQHKNVLLQIGGNWCSWCIKFNNQVTADSALNTYMNQSYVVLHVNYSQENTNDAVMTNLGYPQRFGFPVFIVLDDKGNRLHTQNSEYLEEGKGYSKDKILGFFKAWSPGALDPKNYNKIK
ncbi:thioredoxin family protein [Mucilaginibacter sp. KACC 22773]|uniref:thioredoxin family protein n=1 Tax=Mucilaginibacter sp. KACC 22773 TaxID=3025671 RepID=UPI0023673BDC|nr:thioredoxin family protein [Mucilaginibacter sp. KACC 22773]WDF77492.1 thioredoxin family protein [Mucilaginibacter sp. KACC 22773]